MARNNTAPWDKRQPPVISMAVSNRQFAELSIINHWNTIYLDICTCVSSPMYPGPCPHCREMAARADWIPLAYIIREEMDIRIRPADECTCHAREGETLCPVCERVAANRPIEF